MSEIPWLIKLREGDEKTVREFVNQHRNQVFNTALGLLQDTENAEDVTQEVFIEVFRSVVRFKGDSSILTWIYRITVQKSLEHIRNSRRKKRAGTLLSLFGKEDLVKIKADAPFYHPGIKLENKERAAILFRTIEKLPVNQRTAFTLHKLENLSYAELAEIMGVSVSSVESLMFRAKQNLRKLLGNYYDQNEK
jgi:RNA polymerase sigma-70 factor (ECF subfamily)